MGRGDELHWCSDDGLEGPKGEGGKGQSPLTRLTASVTWYLQQPGFAGARQPIT
jgi:hypothetical protein